MNDQSEFQVITRSCLYPTDYESRFWQQNNSIAFEVKLGSTMNNTIVDLIHTNMGFNKQLTSC